MSQIDPDYDEIEDLDDEEPEPSLVKNLRKQVKDSTKSENEANARADAAERQLAFRDSGLDLTKPIHKFFADHYAGEMTSEAVMKAAVDLEVLSPPAPAVPDEEIQAHAEISAVTAGADTAGSVDPEAAAYAEAVALGKAGTPRKVAEIYEKHGLIPS